MVFKHDSKKKVAFLLSVSEELSQLNFYTLDSVASLNSLSEAISKLFADCQATYVKRIMVTTQSQKQWDNKYKTALDTYNNRNVGIAFTDEQPQDLMSQVKQYKLPVVEAIFFQEQSYNNFPNLWSTLHQSYNTTTNCSIDLQPGHLLLSAIFNVGDIRGTQDLL